MYYWCKQDAVKRRKIDRTNEKKNGSDDVDSIDNARGYKGSYFSIQQRWEYLYLRMAKTRLTYAGDALQIKINRHCQTVCIETDWWGRQLTKKKCAIHIIRTSHFHARSDLPTMNLQNVRGLIDNIGFFLHLLPLALVQYGLRVHLSVYTHINGNNVFPSFWFVTLHIRARRQQICTFAQNLGSFKPKSHTRPAYLIIEWFDCIESWNIYSL